VDGEHNNDLNIYQNTTIIMYLQVGEVLPRFTHKECDRITNKAKKFRWERNYLNCECELMDGYKWCLVKIT
jgi:hypothetical protein